MGTLGRVCLAKGMGTIQPLLPLDSILMSLATIKDSWRSKKRIPDRMFCHNILGPLITPNKSCKKKSIVSRVGTLIIKQTSPLPTWTCGPKVQAQTIILPHVGAECTRITLNGHSSLPPEYPSWDQMQNRMNFPDHLKNAIV